MIRVTDGGVKSRSLSQLAFAAGYFCLLLVGRNSLLFKGISQLVRIDLDKVST